MKYQNKMSLLLFPLLLAGQQTLSAAPTNTCDGQTLNKTFPSGAKWNLCWKVRPAEGLTLSQVSYQAPNHTARRVLGEASLSQLETTLDDGSISPLFLTTEAGLGGNNTTPLNNQDCTNGTLHSQDGRNVMCELTRDNGYFYKYTTQRQTQFWELTSQSQIGPRSYSIRWRLHENGTVEPAIGLSGELPIVDGEQSDYGWPAMASGKIATGFTDHALWRLDFDIGDTANNDVVEEISSIPSSSRLRKTKTINNLDTETGRTFDPETKRFWRIRDASQSNGGIGKISYELVPSRYDSSRANSANEAWLTQDVYFTRYKSCEKHAAKNPTTSCSADVSKFVNQENIKQQDIVVWYKQSYHHLPRSEDSNRIATTWSSFQLLPRDWHPKNPF